jgi:uncharacterized protein YdaU (DUF1376 family)
MAKDPAVLLYTSDFISGTITMTHEQRGKYILLLCIQHQKGKLTEKDLKAILNEEDIEVADKFEKANDDFYYNKRMLEESIKRKNFTESRKANGNKGGRPPKTSIKPNDKPNGYPYAKPTNNLTENENVNVNTDANTVLNKNATVSQYNATGKDFKPKYSEEEFNSIFND